MFEAELRRPRYDFRISRVIRKLWDLTFDLIQLLEKPQIIALTSNVIQLLNRSQFTEVLSYLTQYLKSHSRFRSYNIITLLIQIIPKIFVKQTNNNRFCLIIRNFYYFR